MRRWAGIFTPKPDNSYLSGLMAAGTENEPVLRAELSNMLRCHILTPGQLDGDEHHGIRQSSTLDGVAVMVEDEGPIRLAVTEFKWRASQTDDCGWGDDADKLTKNKLGITVYCQVQHQMWVSGIHRALIYTGCPSGKRRLWTVRYSEVFIEQLFVPALAEAVNKGERSGLPSAVAKHNIYKLMASTSCQIPLLPIKE